MKKTILRYAALGAVAAALGLAQDGPPDPAQMVQMRVDRMTDMLRLSKAQQKQVSAIYTEAQGSNQSVMASMREANQSLAAAIKSNDANAIAQAANTIGTLTAQMTINNAKAEAAVYAQLTPDQQSRYQPMVGGMRGMGMGMGGPGGPGRRGRGGPPPQQ